MAPKTTTAAATSTRAATPQSTPAAPVAANAAKAAKTTLLVDSAQASTLQASPMGIRSDEVAKRAYLIYLEEGCPSGRHLDHWLRAEAELRAH